MNGCRLLNLLVTNFMSYDVDTVKMPPFIDGTTARLGAHAGNRS